jgi:hypothetical protein
MERSDMDGRVAIARRGQPDGWIKSTTYRPELQIHIPQGGIFPNLIIFPFRQRFLATSLSNERLSIIVQLASERRHFCSFPFSLCGVHAIALRITNGT